MPGADPQHTLAPGPVALKTLIGATLEKILASSVFKTADSLRELLRFTLQETLAGRGRDIKK